MNLFLTQGLCFIAPFYYCLFIKVNQLATHPLQMQSGETKWGRNSSTIGFNMRFISEGRHHSDR
jgi:hypothetical protein